MLAYFSFGTLFNHMLISRFKYRDRATIIRDILETINSDPKGKTKTGIMRAANLNFEQVNKYLDLLLLCDAIKAVNPLRSQEVARYRLTQKGLQCLKNAEIWGLMIHAYRRKVV
jgi:predicted transcriptional regulator